MKEKVVLAYSGGLDTTVILHWLAQKDLEVTALFINLGQNISDWQNINENAIKSGAKEVKIIDVQSEFISDYLWPCLMMNAQYEGVYLLGTAIARPLIAKTQIEFAKSIKANYVSHGATGKGNDQARFEIGYMSLDPEIKIIAPWKIAEFYKKYPGRKELIEYSKKHKLPVTATLIKPWSRDENIMHISYEAGMLEDEWKKPLDSMYQWTKSPKDAPDNPTELIIEFKKGVPIAIDGKKYSTLELFKKLNQIAANNAIGRIDIVESRFIGMKSRGVYETPAGSLLLHAHRQIESITLTKDVIELKDSLMPRFANLVYNGYWFTPQMELLKSLAVESQENVNGEVKLELYKGNIITTGRRSNDSLYDSDIASMEKDKGNYNPQDVKGFLKLQALPFIVDKKRKLNKKNKIK